MFPNVDLDFDALLRACTNNIVETANLILDREKAFENTRPQSRKPEAIEIESEDESLSFTDDDTETREKREKETEKQEKKQNTLQGKLFFFDLFKVYRVHLIKIINNEATFKELFV